MPQNSEDLPIKQDNATTALPTCQTAARSRKSPASPPLGHLLVPRSGFFCYPGQRKGNPHAGCAVSLETGAGAFPTAGGVRRMARKRGSAVGTADFSPHPKPPLGRPGQPIAKAFRKVVSDLQKGKRGRLLGALCPEVGGLFQRWSAKGRGSGNGTSPALRDFPSGSFELGRRKGRGSQRRDPRYGSASCP